MRLAFCIFKHFPFGGIQRDMLKMVRECLGCGHGVRIYTVLWLNENPQMTLSFAQHRSGRWPIIAVMKSSRPRCNAVLSDGQNQIAIEAVDLFERFTARNQGSAA